MSSLRTPVALRDDVVDDDNLVDSQWVSAPYPYSQQQKMFDAVSTMDIPCRRQYLAVACRNGWSEIPINSNRKLIFYVFYFNVVYNGEAIIRLMVKEAQLKSGGLVIGFDDVFKQL